MAPGGAGSWASKPLFLTIGTYRWVCSPSGKAIYRKQQADGSQAPVPWRSVAMLCAKTDLVPGS